MVIGLVRTKLVAVLIGPSGVGLLGIYQSITGLASTIAGLGIQTSGVRDVAKNHSEGNRCGVAKIITSLQRVSWITGLVGMLIFVAFAPWISRISFGSSAYTWQIVALSITIMLTNVTAGQDAILQGTRRIGDLARISIFGALFGTMIAVGLYAWLGIEGIVPYLVIAGLMSLGLSTFFARKIEVETVATTWQESCHQSGSLIRFGLAMVVGSIVAALVTYMTRVLIIRDFGLTGAGIFTAAFTFSGMFVQFVLGAMGADFYPRLTSVSNDHTRMNELINQQTEIGLLLAYPGLLATLVLAPYAIAIFYTVEFAPAGEMLKWFVIGCMGRVLSWPLGFSLIAKGQSGLFMASETVFHILHLAMIWVGLYAFGLVGVSVAFALLYLFHTIGMALITRHTIGFSWSVGVWQQLRWMLPLASVIFLGMIFLPLLYAIPLGLVANAVASILCLRFLVIRLGFEHRIPRTIHAIPGASLLLRGLNSR